MEEFVNYLNRLGFTSQIDALGLESFVCGSQKVKVRADLVTFIVYDYIEISRRMKGDSYKECFLSLVESLVGFEASQLEQIKYLNNGSNDSNRKNAFVRNLFNRMTSRGL
jgi:hypothetical protein